MHYLKRIRSNISSDFIKVVTLFLSWKLVLLLFLVISFNFHLFPTTNNYLGGGGINYILPEIYSWANFDGEHFLSIAKFGYKPLEQAFFPLYPALMSLLQIDLVDTRYNPFFNLVFIGLIISHLAFLVALLFLWKLIKEDYSGQTSFGTILVMLLFPTSFYFGAVYSESIFLLLTVLSFYFARRSNWWLAGIFGFFASLTRVFGVLLLPALLIEAYQQKQSYKKIIGLALIPLGLLSYMIYDWYFFGDPLAFYNLQTVVGEQHQKGIVLLPQVLYRYIRILLTFDPANILYQTILLEFFVGILFFILPIYGFIKKVRLSYLFYAFTGFLLTTVQGSFSSLPRYVIVLFPSFLILYLIFSKSSLPLKIILALGALILLGFETMLFLKGYWVA